MPSSSPAEQLDILSIQSGVMAGAVGNDAAGPIYAQRDLKAARLDTVRLAAHPGHGVMRAHTTPANTLSELLARTIILKVVFEGTTPNLSDLIKLLGSKSLSEI